MILVDAFTGSADRSEKAKDLMSLSKFLNQEPVAVTVPVKGRQAQKIYADSGIITAGITVPVWIRAHFVRHRPISIADDFMSLLQRDDVLDVQIDYPVNMMISASKDIWASLLGKRSCWLTQSTFSSEHDPWDTIIGSFLGLMGDQVLPCANGVCPYHRDARNRLLGTDPGVPCPRYIKLNSIPVDPSLAARIAQALKSRGAYWREAHASLLHSDTQP
jgi:hypothetical protein